LTSARYALLALRAALGAVFIVSGYQKLTSPVQNFEAVIGKFEMLPGPAVSFVAHTLPWAELVGGALFVFGLWTGPALFVLWAMNSAFIAALGAALLRKLPIEECGCFGEALTLSPKQMLGIDAALWALFLLFFTASRRLRPPSLDDTLGP
jgi:uncharacterized membrane protein YphA (DoxX/SURF4 family)